MELLVYALRHLLTQQQYVSLPGIGSLVKEYTPASINEHLGIIDPPRITYGFISERKYDDGAIREFIKEYIPIDDLIQHTPETLLEQWMRPLLAELQGGRSVYLDGIGTLHPNGSAYSFAPEPITSSASLYCYDEALILPRARGVSKTKKRSKRLIGVISIALLVGVTLAAAYLSSQDNLLERLNINIPALDMVALHTPPATAPASPIQAAYDSLSSRISDSTLSAAPTQMAPEQGNAELTAAPLTSSTTSKKRRVPTANNIKLKQNEALKVPTAKTAPTHSYYLICGTFQQEENAQKLQSTLTQAGYSVEINVWDGKHYVSIGKYSTKSEAVAKRNESLKRLPDYDIWVLAREL